MDKVVFQVEEVSLFYCFSSYQFALLSFVTVFSASDKKFSQLVGRSDSPSHFYVYFSFLTSDINILRHFWNQTSTGLFSNIIIIRHFVHHCFFIELSFKFFFLFKVDKIQPIFFACSCYAFTSDSLSTFFTRPAKIIIQTAFFAVGIRVWVDRVLEVNIGNCSVWK